jgi:Lon protease-like protein
VSDTSARGFPLFPLQMVVLPTEVVPLHIFEERYKTMVETCLASESEFGIVWLADDGLREYGCACRIERVTERFDDGRMNLLVRGTRPLRILERERDLAYPAGLVAFPEDVREPSQQALLTLARRTYSELVQKATERELSDAELGSLSAYEMAATVDFGLESKQTLLELRSEQARLRLVTRLFRAALKRLDFVDRAQARARSNGKVRFG